MNKALVKTATGEVVNIITIEPDSDGGFDHFRCEDGCELLPAGLEELGAVGPGWSWDGSQFSPPDLVVSRLDELMHSPPVVMTGDVEVLADEILDGSVPKDDETLAAEAAELLTLLHAKLDSDDTLTPEELRKMLQLERES